MSNISEIAANLKQALEESERCHAALEESRLKLAPQEQAAKKADDAVAVLIAQYTGMTQPSQVAAPSRRAGGAGKSRGPRPFLAIALTSGSRNLAALKEQGKSKAEALKAVMERIHEIAATRKETVTPEIEAAVKERAGEVFGKK